MGQLDEDSDTGQGLSGGGAEGDSQRGTGTYRTLAGGQFDLVGGMDRTHPAISS